MNTSRLAFCCSFRRDQRENKTKKNNGPDADECYGYRTRRLVLVPLTKRFCFVFFFAFEIKCFFFQATGHHKRHHRKQEEEDRRKIPTKNKKKKERKKEQKKTTKKQTKQCCHFASLTCGCGRRRIGESRDALAGCVGAPGRREKLGKNSVKKTQTRPTRRDPITPKKTVKPSQILSVDTWQLDYWKFET